MNNVLKPIAREQADGRPPLYVWFETLAVSQVVVDGAAQLQATLRPHFGIGFVVYERDAAANEPLMLGAV